MAGTEIGDWQRGVTADEGAAVSALLGRVRDADRRAPDDPPSDDDQVLLARQAGNIVGLAWHNGADPAELLVDPGRRGQGVGTVLARAVWEADRGIWAHGTARAAQAIAAAGGASAVRELIQMRRPLRDLVEITAPEGVSIRSFIPGDDDAGFLAVNARAFAWHPEQGRLDQAGLDEEMTQPWFDAAGFFLAVTTELAEHESMLGFHWTKIHAQDPTPAPDARTPAAPIGEVYVIAVDPDSPIRGLGAPLTAAGLNYLTVKGLSEVMLYVESDNDPAIALYRRLGFSDYATDTVFTLSS